MTKDEIAVYYEGLREGVKMYAWWKDGQQYVGTTGKTLKLALEHIDKEELNLLRPKS